MRTLLCLEDGDPIWCLCPKRHKCWNIETNDYVNLNCLVWCDESCKSEFMLCLKGENSRVNEYEALKDGNPGDTIGCSTVITEEEALEFMHSQNISPPEERTESKLTYIMTTILELTGIEPYVSPVRLPDDDRSSLSFSFSSTEDEEEERERHINNIRKLEKPVLLMDDCGFPYDHGGVNMGYSAYCSNCKVEFKDYIWGD